MACGKNCVRALSAVAIFLVDAVFLIFLIAAESVPNKGEYQ